MKCVKLHGGKIIRVPDHISRLYVNKEKGEVCQKDAWKQQEKRGKYAE